MSSKALKKTANESNVSCLEYLRKEVVRGEKEGEGGRVKRKPDPAIDVELIRKRMSVSID